MNALLWHARGWPAGQRPSLVGRLDKLTSGVVVVAKTRGDSRGAAARDGGRSDTEKDYLAVVYGRVNVARGEIDLRLAAIAPIARRVVASAHVGAPSLTRFERLARVAAPARRPVAAALPARHRPHASDPRAPGRARLADRRRPGLRRAAMAQVVDDGARRGAAGISAPGAPRVARRRDASGDPRAPDRSRRRCRATSRNC